MSNTRGEQRQALLGLQRHPTLLRARGRPGASEWSRHRTGTEGRRCHRAPGGGVPDTLRYGSSQLRMPAEDVSPLDTFVRHARREVGKPFVEECSKSIEVSEGVERPLDLYWPGHRRNPGVPHVRSHCTTWSCGTREPSAALPDRRSSSATSSASASLGAPVKRRKFGDQLGDGHAEFGCSGLEHIRSVLVDLDADVGVHATRIADPETAGSGPRPSLGGGAAELIWPRRRSVPMRGESVGKAALTASAKASASPPERSARRRRGLRYTPRRRSAAFSSVSSIFAKQKRRTMGAAER
jgi:hypothetical protein